MKMDKYFIKWSLVIISIIVLMIIFTIGVFGRLDDFWILSVPAGIVMATKFADEERKEAP
jgi:hypothetical protein